MQHLPLKGAPGWTRLVFWLDESFNHRGSTEPKWRAFCDYTDWLLRRIR